MRVVLMIGDFEDGGVERTLTNLAAGLVDLGVAVDLLVGRPRHPYVRALPPGVSVVALEGPREVALSAYLATAQPDVLLTGKLADDRVALAVRARLGSPLKLATTVGTPLSAREEAFRWNPLKRWRERRRIRAEYARLDGITAVSEAVADDLRRVYRIAGVPLRVLRNPIIPEDVAERANAPCPHPWLADDGPPVVLAIGGLRKVKDFPTLLRAFARWPPASDPRLLILGAGKEQGRLHALASRLGLDGRVAFPGFVADPYPYLSRARMLVLSSRREGLGNVLVEALSVGTPVVATDCPGGVREVLDEGRLGALVPVGDAPALAEAMAAVLAAPPDPARLRGAVAPYRIPVAARGYLGFFNELMDADAR